jgi:type VI secretion system secreted protein VgrG
MALEAGGINTTGRQADAKSYGPFLIAKGFKEVPKTNSAPKKGDIVVIQPYPGGNQAGHIAMYDGGQWVSDFKQKDFWGGPGYRKNRPSHTFYRPQ